IYEILRAGKKEAYLGGNIGSVLLDQLSTIDDKTFVILELSSFQLEDLDVSPHYAVVLGIMPEHLDHHKSAQHYFSAKSNIVVHQTPKDRVVLCADYPVTKQLALALASKKYWVSTQSIAEPGGYQAGGQLCLNLDGREEIICQTDELQLAGKHNWQNVLAAAVIARLVGVGIAHIRQAILNFRGLPHRLQIVGTFNGVVYVNDSLSTIPESAIAAIEAFPAPKILILGGSEKFSDYRNLAEKIAASDVRAIFLIGQTSPKIKKALQDAGFTGVISDDIDNLQDIVREASSIASRGDVVLLSPASASFGLFKDYADRGRQFEQAVKKLIERDETGQT
ncbi:MAG: UDP-N-acetylmuramoyl-L-alanine--D-glutamate ligase, partial [bacterium]|nr:UDP-N-acetylmuramoyl-L-alanine--D-glutamate ligase [bacterium]